MRPLTLLAIACMLAACGGEVDGPRRDGGFGVFDGGDRDGQGSSLDSDEDGLCDATEEEIGSDQAGPDTDSDGLPDVVELIYGFGVTDPRSPEADQVLYLEARPGAEASLTVRFTVDGKGSDYSGYFEDIPTPYDDGTSAGLYLKSSQAIRSEPPEATRVVDGPKQSFRAVLGSARLELEVLFRAGNEVDPETCTRAYPFRYGLREDGGGRVEDRLHLLVLAPADGGEPEDYCQPAYCF